MDNGLFPTVPQSGSSRFREAVVSLVDQHWKLTHTGLLLSRLGKNLADLGFSLRGELHGERLAEFLMRELSAQIQVKRSPENPTTTIALPANLPAGVELDSVFPAPGVPSAAPKGRRFPPVLWNAFTSRLDEGFVRQVHLGPPPRYEDAPEADIQQGLPVVSGDEVMGPRTSLNQLAYTAEVERRIEQWLSDNQLDVDSFAKVKRAEASPGGSSERQSALSALLSSLSDQDLRRVQLPLDIVKKLLKS